MNNFERGCRVRQPTKYFSSGMEKPAYFANDEKLIVLSTTHPAFVNGNKPNWDSLRLLMTEENARRICGEQGIGIGQFLNRIQLAIDSGDWCNSLIWYRAPVSGIAFWVEKDDILPWGEPAPDEAEVNETYAEWE